MISDSSIIPFDYNINCGGGGRSNEYGIIVFTHVNRYVLIVSVSFKFLVWFRNSISRRKVTRHLHFQFENERKNQNSTTNTHTHTSLARMCITVSYTGQTENRAREQKDTRSDLINNNGFDIHHIFIHSVRCAVLCWFNCKLTHSFDGRFVRWFTLPMYRHQMLCVCCVPPTLDN